MRSRTVSLSTCSLGLAGSWCSILNKCPSKRHFIPSVFASLTYRMSQSSLVRILPRPPPIPSSLPHLRFWGLFDVAKLNMLMPPNLQAHHCCGSCGPAPPSSPSSSMRLICRNSKVYHGGLREALGSQRREERSRSSSFSWRESWRGEVSRPKSEKR